MADKDRKKSFVIYEDWMNIILSLPDTESLDLVRTLFSYCLGKEYNGSPVSNGLLATMKPTIDDDVAKYNNRRQKNYENIQKRWNKSDESNTMVYDGIQSNTTVLQSNTKSVDIDIDTDIDVDTDGDRDKDNAFPSERPKEKGDSVSQREVVERIVERWNNLPDCIPKVKAIDMKTERFKMLKERLKTYSEEDVMSAIDNIETSPFLLGDNKNRWVIKFDWFVRPNNFPKVYEGQYNTGKTTVFSQPRIARGISIVDEMIARGELRND